MRYITQMSAREGYALALYDTAQGRVIADFVDPEVAEQVKEKLNARPQK